MKADAFILLGAFLLTAGCATQNAVPIQQSSRHFSPAKNATITAVSADPEAAQSKDMEIVELLDALIVVFRGNTTKAAEPQASLPVQSATLQPTQLQLPE